MGEQRSALRCENIAEHEKTGKNENSENITESGTRWARRYFGE